MTVKRFTVSDEALVKKMCDWISEEADADELCYTVEAMFGVDAEFDTGNSIYILTPNKDYCGAFDNMSKTSIENALAYANAKYGGVFQKLAESDEDPSDPWKIIRSLKERIELLEKNLPACSVCGDLLPQSVRRVEHSAIGKDIEIFCGPCWDKRELTKG